jgi:hypothetical protein
MVMKKSLIKTTLCLAAVGCMAFAPSAFAGGWGHGGYYRGGGYYHGGGYYRGGGHYDGAGRWIAGAIVAGAVVGLVASAVAPRPVYYDNGPVVYSRPANVVYERDPVVVERVTTTRYVRDDGYYGN